MLVVTDLSDIFLPIPDDLLVNLNDSMDLVYTLLESIPGYFAKTQVFEGNMINAITAAR